MLRSTIGAVEVDPAGLSAADVEKDGWPSRPGAADVLRAMRDSTAGAANVEQAGPNSTAGAGNVEQAGPDSTTGTANVEPAGLGAADVDLRLSAAILGVAYDPTALGGPSVDASPPTASLDFPGTPPAAAPVLLKDAFVRQLQLDRLTLRQMRSWLMSDEARRAIEVAAGATEATYERLALILFGVDLPQLLGKQTAVQPGAGISAEERLELQREKARIRARLRRAAAKATRQLA
jgi:hypothetical protein